MAIVLTRIMFALLATLMVSVASQNVTQCTRDCWSTSIQSQGCSSKDSTQETACMCTTEGHYEAFYHCCLTCIYEGQFQDLDSAMECVGYRRRDLDTPSTFETRVKRTPTPQIAALTPWKTDPPKPKPVWSSVTWNTHLGHTINYCGVPGSPCDAIAVAPVHEAGTKRQYEPTTLVTYGLPGVEPSITGLPAISTIATPAALPSKRWHPLVATSAAFLDTPPAIPYFIPGQPVRETGLDVDYSDISERDGMPEEGMAIDQDLFPACCLHGHCAEPMYCDRQPLARQDPYPAKYPTIASSMDWLMTPTPMLPHGAPSTWPPSPPPWGTPMTTSTLPPDPAETTTVTAPTPSYSPWRPQIGQPIVPGADWCWGPLPIGIMPCPT